MTIDEVKAVAKHALDFAMRRLREKKPFAAMCHLLPAEGVAEVIQIDGDLLNDREAKYNLGRFLKTRAKEIGAVAAVFTTDAYIARITDPERWEQLQAAGVSGGDTALLERLGVAQRRECLMFSVETPIFCQFGMQFYARAKDGSLVFQEYEECADAHVEGNFFGFFEEAPTGRVIA